MSAAPALSVHRCRAARRGALALAAALALLAVSAPRFAHARTAAPELDAAQADSLVATHAVPDRDARLAAWAKRASLDDLMWVLRRDPETLGSAEAPLAEAALARTPVARLELRRRLEARLALASPRARHAGADPALLAALRPRASAFRVGVLLPDRGDYAGYAAGVRGGLRAGLAYGRRAGEHAPEVEEHGTGECEVPRAAAALDSVARTCACVVGELLSVPTTALAAATRVLELPLVSPTASDESVSRIGPMVFQVGPSGALRGRELARALIATRGRRVALVTSSAATHTPFADGFAAAAESLGASIVRRETYPAGAADFRTIARSLKAAGADLAFWDGESREADALLRQLATDGANVRLCGGAALAPEQFHSTSRLLLEGVAWVADDWQLAAPQQALLDSLARSQGDRAGAMWVRGFLAGRRIAAAVDAGARTPVELAARLRSLDPGQRALGFLDCTQDGARVPVWFVQRGRSIEPGRH